MNDLLEKFTRLDKQVRDAEKNLSTYEAQLLAYEKREREILDQADVDSVEEFETQLATLRAEVEKGLNDWQAKVQKVNEVIREVEARVGYGR